MPDIETLMIDNFDSFTWNLYQQLSNLGANVTVIRNDALNPSDFPNLRIKNLIISPGPGHPRTDSGISREAIQYFAGKVPVLGVCMGLECVVDVYGGDIAYAGEIKHGKTSNIKHDNKGCYKDVPQNLPSTRYHSLSAHIRTLPDELAITSATEESGVIQGVRHRKHTVEAVQYHPESIMSAGGDAFLKNFLALRGGTWEENPSYNVHETRPDAQSSASSSQSAKVPSVLDNIHARRLKDVELAKSTPGTTPSDLAGLLAMHLAPPLIPLVPRLRARTPALMAEIKRASPSKGPIAMNINAAQQALTYALAGASVISVLTEPTWFKGSLLDMRLVRQIVDSLPNRPAILRKDFIVDEYQISEARLHGADTVLLIVALLPLARLRALYSYSLSLGMEPLVEVNNAQEMKVALDIGAKVVGVNNRNLHDFEVDMTNTSRLSEMCKEKDVILCALSGISTPEHVRNYAAHGVGAVLIGEALMKAPSPTAFIHHLLDIPAPKDDISTPSPPLVKICGVRDPEIALVAAEAGTDFIGLVFAPNSRRRVTVPAALEISNMIRTYRQKENYDAEDAAPGVPDGEPTQWFTSHARQLRHKLTDVRPFTVGVFQSQPLEEIIRIVSAAQLDFVQLHGDEPAQWAQHIPVPVIRAFHIPADGSATADIKELTRPGLHQYLLLDASVPGEKLSGGAGISFDWEIAKKVVDAGESPVPLGRAQEPLPVILAGGLNAENVRVAVEKVKPLAVDVSGGVETDGEKDPIKIKAFVKEARGALLA